MTISSTDDIIDSRDVIARIQELKDEKFDFEEENLGEEWEDNEELDALESLESDAQYYGDWAHGATLINSNYFTEYCEALCVDIGAVSSDLPDYIVIDWEQTAENIKADYSEIDFDGESFFIRD